jgi:hypothetical protein
MLIKVQELQVGDKLVSDKSSKHILITDIQLQEDGVVKVTLENGFVEWFMENKIVIAHRPVQ